MLDNISITGITPLECYPKGCNIKNCKQNIQQINVCIPCQKPEMESINEIKATICINKYKLLNTILGPKILINGVIKIKVIYTAKNIEQSLHSAHWDIEFCDFILLDNICYDECNICLSNFFTGIEDICINSCDERYIDLSLLYIICANFNSQLHEKNYSCNHFQDSCSKGYKATYKSNGKNNLNTYYYPAQHYENLDSNNIQCAKNKLN